MLSPNKNSCFRPSSASEFSSLIKQHGKFVRNFIEKKVWETQDVDDIYQTTLLEAFKSYSKFRGESHPRTWLCGIAYIVFKNYLKKKNTHRLESIENIISFDENNLAQHHQSLAESPEVIHSQQQMLDRIEKAYNSLPKDMRITFNAVVGEGNSYVGTSKKYNIPVGTVRSRISRARELFREQCY